MIASWMKKARTVSLTRCLSRQVICDRATFALGFRNLFRSETASESEPFSLRLLGHDRGVSCGALPSSTVFHPNLGYEQLNALRPACYPIRHDCVAVVDAKMFSF